jgi:hypothetical protein
MPSNPNRKPAVGILAALSVAIVLYSLFIVQQILLGLIVAVAPWLLYLLVRFVFILERIATALEGIAAAHARNQETDGAGPAGDYQPPSEASERATETDGGVENE